MLLTASGPSVFFCLEKPVDLAIVPDKNLRPVPDIQQVIYD
jgi:hypothetical protein